MKQAKLIILCSIIILGWSVFVGAADTTHNGATMNKFTEIFPRGGENTAYAQYFVGKSYLNMLSTQGAVIANVTFEPACRNNWHIHHATKGGGQILLCTAGRGWYQEWGKPARELHPGDVVNIPAGVKHWHGAAKDSWFAHVAVEISGENAKNEWLEPVKRGRLYPASLSCAEKAQYIVGISSPKFGGLG